MSMKWYPFYMKSRGKWYPKSVSHSRAVTTEQLCNDIAQASTVAPGDVAAVLRTLSDAMVKYLADGRPVKLDNIGTFRLIASASGSGVNTEEEVTTEQFNKMMVRFLAEKVKPIAGLKTVSIPVLAATEIEWERTKPKTTKTSNATPSDDNQDPVETANVVITANVNDPTMGTVSGGGTYVQGASVTLTATANSGYHFVQWSNGRTTASITVTAEADATLTATFAADNPGGNGGDNGMDG